MNQALHTPITDVQKEAYDRDGAICVRGAFDQGWIEALAEGVEDVMADPSELVRENTPEDASGRFFVDFCMWRRFPAFRAFALESPGAELAAAFMGSERVRYYHDHLLVKEPDTAERTLWHHDQPYWPVDGSDICSIWLPLDPVPRSTCPEWVRGSHRWGKWFAPRYFKNAADLSAHDAGFDEVPDVDGDRASHDLLSYELEPGDCVVFGALTLHGAPGNASKRRRRAYATRWTGDDATWAERPGRISPPIEGHGLRPGDPIGGELFPEVWPR